jgi:predicted HAD superfamily Cof-like phosphohydrolase
MKSMFKQVGDFHTEILGLEHPEIPTFNRPEWIIERTRFMMEEVQEFTSAAITGDMVEAADGLADVVYVALGTAWMMGIPFEKIFSHVHNCNMKKQRGVTVRGNAIDAIKPPGWVRPNEGIAKILEDDLDQI